MWILLLMISGASAEFLVSDKCPVGYYLTLADGYSMEGQWVLYHGERIQYGVEAGLTGTLPGDCIKCPAGYTSQRTWQQAGYNPDPWNCEACLAAVYSDEEGLEYCKNCPAGWVNRWAKQTKCTQCQPGTGSYKTYQLCFDCLAGKYSNGGDVHYPCRTCPLGRVSGKGAASCEICGTGQFANTDTCTDCPLGKWSDAGGETNSCKDCPEGKSTSAVGSISDTCTECPAGEFAELGSPCTSCPGGKWSDSTGAINEDTCKDCPEGKSTAEGSISDTCTGCPAGKFAGTGSPCTDCPAGKWSDSTEAINEDTCKDCPRWKTSVPGSSTCEPCPEGRFTSTEGAAPCEGCPAGKYTSLYEISNNPCDQYILTEEECIAAAASLGYNYHSAITSYHQYYTLKCSIGGENVFWNEKSYGGACGSNGKCICKVGSCKTCGEGKYSDEPDQLTCKDCEPGRYHTAGMMPQDWLPTYCEDCARGRFSPDGQKDWCQACSTGYYADETGLSECKQCSPGTWALEDSNQCTDIPFGDLAQIIAPRAEETVLYNGQSFGISSSPCHPLGSLLKSQCETAAASLGKDFGWNNDKMVIQWSNYSHGCINHHNQDTVYYNTDTSIGNRTCNDDNGCKYVCDIGTLKCAPPVVVYTSISTGSCDTPLTKQECAKYAASNGRDFNQRSSPNRPTGCSSDMDNSWTNWNAPSSRDCGFENHHCICKRSSTTQEKKDACIAVNGCWWGPDGCTEGCDLIPNFDTRECQVERAVYPITGSCDHETKTACLAVDGCWWHGDGKCTERCDKTPNFDTRECGLKAIQTVLAPPEVETVLYPLISTGSCDNPVTKQECEEYANSNGRDFNEFTTPKTNKPPGCSSDRDNSWTHWNPSSSQDCGYDNHDCVCKVPKCSHDTKDACVAVDGCWWGPDGCTEGCDLIPNLDTRECQVERAVYPITGSCDHETKTACLGGSNVCWWHKDEGKCKVGHENKGLRDYERRITKAAQCN